MLYFHKVLCFVSIYSYREKQEGTQFSINYKNRGEEKESRKKGKEGEKWMDE